MRKCFTINPLRTAADIKSYLPLFEEGIYEAIEIFYPTPQRQDAYAQSIMAIKEVYPAVEVVMHLPYGKEYDLCNFDRSEEVLSHMSNAIHYASRFSVRKLTLHLGYVDSKNNRLDIIHHIIGVLKYLLAVSKPYNMFLMIENMPGNNELGYSPDEIYNIITSVASNNIKFILDTGHANVSEFSVNDYLDRLSSFLYHIHFSDNDGISDRHAPLGSGTIDFYGIFRKLKEISYNELHCLEILFNDERDLRRNAFDIQKYYDACNYL